jgi:orotate phosphoribosyltransferase
VLFVHRKVNPMIHDTEGWIREYQRKGALWIHDGNAKHPHALLTSGKHSNGFFNSRLVILDEVLLSYTALDLLEILRNSGEIEDFDVDIVVGPQTGATKLAELISGQIPDCTGYPCHWASPAKNEQQGQKSMIFSDEDLRRLPGSMVLLCEDVLTTCGSIDLTATAVTNAGGIVLPVILALVNRSGLTEAGGKKIIALIDRPMPMWTPDECPLCRMGSEALRPKDNWDQLNAQ